MQVTIESAEEFVRLRSSDVMKEQMVSSHCIATNEVWLDVVDRFPEYARWVAHNKSISEEIIRILAKHPDSNVRSFIAMKRRTPSDVLWELAKDKSESVRERVAFNAKTPSEILEFLCNDSVPRIQARVRLRLQLGGETKPL